MPEDIVIKISPKFTKGDVVAYEGDVEDGIHFVAVHRVLLGGTLAEPRISYEVTGLSIKAKVVNEHELMTQHELYRRMDARAMMAGGRIAGGRLRVDRVGVISTAHVSREEGQLLDILKNCLHQNEAYTVNLITRTFTDVAASTVTDLVSCMVNNPYEEYGWMFRCDGAEPLETLSKMPGLQAVLVWAYNQQLDFIRLDCDANKHPELKTYAW